MTKEQSNGRPGKPTTSHQKEGSAYNTLSLPPKTAQAAYGFPIVGIGASAGGLAAFQAFFSGMPEDTNPHMAFVLVQHLAPDHKCILTDLIQRCTPMQVFEVEDGMTVQINCVYIIPPNRDMVFLNGTLQLLEPAAPHGHRLPIDFFFRSLAQDQQERAIGVVLSGTGSDGTLGILAINDVGGMVFAQNPESAEYDGMPRSAIATGQVDFELPPAKMPAQLIAYVTHAFGKLPRPAVPSPKFENTLKNIFVLLHAQTGHDFSQYKPSTIERRIERRIAVQLVDTIEDYVKFLQQSPEEAGALCRDLLIGVTHFFRDPDAFQALEEQVIPKLFAGKRAKTDIRIWVPGCSTGEEAYSLAILLVERQEVLKQSFKIQIFATDINSQAIATARAGFYPDAIAANLTPERLARFFVAKPGGGGYRVQKSIRDLLVFSEQNVIMDPPFSKLDMLSCRNLLIYLNGALQQKLIPLFHYALNPGGHLFLGTSEGVSGFDDLFAILECRQKIYQRKEDLLDAGNVAQFVPPRIPPRHALPQVAKKPVAGKKRPLRELTEQALLQQMVQAAALVTAQGYILYLHGRTGLYLEPAPGESGTSNILKMAREGLHGDLTTALHKAAVANETVCCPALRVKTNGDFTTVKLIVRPVVIAASASPEQPLYLVILEPVPEPVNPPVPLGPAGEDVDARIAALKQELQAKDEYLQAIDQELETSNQELKSSNEEMQAGNEELQSTNEELETSKEELQSVNEELATVNNELQSRVTDLSRANNDMNNLLAGTGIATFFVDHQLRILRFTPSTSEIINLIQNDIGRPVSHIVSNLSGYDSLKEDIQAVLDTLIPREAEVQTAKGRWFTMRILPYRTLYNVIEGAVVTFIDITERRRIEVEGRVSKERLRVALCATSIILFTQDTELRYIWIHNPNPAFKAQQVLGKTDADLLSAPEAAILTALKQQVLSSGKSVRQEIQTTIAGENSVYDLTVEPLRDDAGAVIGITCAALGITGQQGLDRLDAGEP